ncbi:MAG: ATP synthase F1 subunit gamma [Patescibacteria group bacterium]
MANTRQIKRRISTANNISKITKAMEMVAASKMKRAQDQALAARPYALTLVESLNALTRVVDPKLHPLLKKHQTGLNAVLLLATDKGLCGSLNTHLLKQLLQLKKKYGENLTVIAVGKRGVMAARSLGLNVFAQFTQIQEKVTAGDISPITQLVIDGYLEGEFQSVELIYMDFINTLSQLPRLEQLLPIVSLKPKEEDSSIIDKKLASDYIFEPNPRAILDRLLPFYVENTIFHSFLELRASEHSARMVAMKNASENASELVDELKLIYNKSRQQAITNELLEITTATLALS